MPWCPKCRSEYRTGFNVCNDCDSELVEELEPLNPSQEHEYDTEAYLTNVGDGIEAEMLITMLKSYGIPVLEKTREAGGYNRVYMGVSAFGVDLYVPSKMLERAKDIIESYKVPAVEEGRKDYYTGNNKDTSEDSSESDSRDDLNKRSFTKNAAVWITRFYIVLFTLTILWYLVGLVTDIIKNGI